MCEYTDNINTLDEAELNYLNDWVFANLIWAGT